MIIHIMTFTVAHWDTWYEGLQLSMQGEDIIEY